MLTEGFSFAVAVGTGGRALNPAQEGLAQRNGVGSIVCGDQGS